MLGKTRALILYISIWIFDFGPKSYRDFRETGPEAGNFVRAGLERSLVR